MVTESKAKPSQAGQRQRDTTALSFCCCLTWFPPQSAVKGKSPLLLRCKSLPPSPRAHCTPVPSSTEIQALPLQRYSPRREALNQNCAFSCLVQGGRDPRVTFVSVSGHQEERGRCLLAHVTEEQRGSSPCTQGGLGVLLPS